MPLFSWGNSSHALSVEARQKRCTHTREAYLTHPHFNIYAKLYLSLIFESFQLTGNNFPENEAPGSRDSVKNPIGADPDCWAPAPGSDIGCAAENFSRAQGRRFRAAAEGLALRSARPGRTRLVASDSAVVVV
jgi:hypothetical protein